MNIRLGVLTNYTDAPANYRCAPHFISTFLSCLNASRPESNCFGEARSICPFPGPGLVPEIVAHFLGEQLRLDEGVSVELREFNVANGLSTYIQWWNLIKNDTVDFWMLRNAVTTERLEKGYTYTYPIELNTGYGFISRTDALYTDAPGSQAERVFAAMKPFASHVWYSLLVVILAYALAVSVIDWRVQRKSDRKRSLSARIASAFWTLFAQFSGSSFNTHVIPPPPSKVGKKTTSSWRSYSFLVLLWSSFSFLLQNLYSSTITSSLLVPPEMRKKFSNAPELGALMVAEGYRVVHYGPVTSYDEAYAASNDTRIQTFVREMRANAIEEKDITKIVPMLLADPKLVYIGPEDTFGSLIFNHTLCDLLVYQRDTYFPRVLLAFFVSPQKVWLRERLSAHLQKLLIGVLLRKYNVIADERCSSATRSTDFRPIVLDDFSGILVLLLAGLAICTVALVVEFVRKSC